eukprot:maker-scaffold_19-snap-gene-1.5-mRNA-1 protein AED:0.00 eAED:0.00 QI:150/1/1/1/1/1/2/1090/102
MSTNHTKRALRGIFMGKKTGFGNNVSFSERKSRRTFKPNVQTKTLYSEILDERFKINVTTRALKTIRKYDGLDNFLLKKPNLIKDSLFAQNLRKRIVEKINS